MKILPDTCVWGGTCKQLELAGYDVIWTGNWTEDPGDEEILNYAYNEGRILVTLDKDFGELAILQGVPHCGILRLVNIAAKQQANICLQILRKHSEDLLSGAILTAELGRLRIRN